MSPSRARQARRACGSTACRKAATTLPATTSPSVQIGPPSERGASKDSTRIKERKMSISDTTENAILNLVFRAVAWANYADNAATTPETNIIVALHTADPGDAGAQNTTESAYTNYARVNVLRST